MQKNNLPIYGLVALVILFITINFQHVVSFTEQISRNSVKNSSEAAVLASQNNVSCQTPGRKHNLIPVRHHVGKDEMFTDFADCPTRIAVASGDWNSPSTWGGVLPEAKDVVLIPSGLNVTLRKNVQVKTLGVKGIFNLDPASNNTFKVTDFITYPGSRLNITPDENAVQTISFVGSVNTNVDPGQFGLGFVAIDSDVNIVGRQTQNTNARIAPGGAMAGSTNVTVFDNISDWKVGQNIILADSIKGSNAYIPNTEVKRIVGINGNTITLDTSLQNTYKSSVVYMGQNVRFTSDASTSGHIMFTGNTKLRFEGSYIEKMGRTRSAPTGVATISPDGEVQSIAANQIGRYSLHMHHLEQPYSVVGNVINNSGDPMLRWSATLHMSYGNFENNSIVNPGEAGIGIETLMDAGTVKNNLIIGAGGGGEYDSQIQSFGIWSRSSFTDIIDNRVEGYVKTYAYFIDTIDHSIYPTSKSFPTISGSPLSGKTIGSRPSPGEFRGNVNTAYIGFPTGNTFRRAGALWVGNMFGSTFRVKDFTSTHGGVISFYTRDTYFDELKLNETEEGSNSSQMGFTAIQSAPTVVNSVIKGFDIGYMPTGISKLKDSVLDNKYDVVTVMGDEDCFCHTDSSGETTILESVKFSPNGVHIALGVFNVDMWEYLKTKNSDLLTKNLTTYIQSGPENFARLLAPNRRILVRNYNMDGRDLVVYPNYQAANFNIPVVNITNQDMFDGKGTHPYTTGVVGRSLGDHIVRNPISNSRIIGLVESVTPAKVIQDDNYFFPKNVSSDYSLKYYVNSSATKLNLSNFLIDYGGQAKVIENVKMNRGLNKYRITLDNNQPYTLLAVGPDGLPTSATDTNFIPQENINTLAPLPTPNTLVPPVTPIQPLNPVQAPINVLSTGIKPIVTISSPRNGITLSNSNPIIFTATASGGTGAYKYYWNFGDGVLNNVSLGSYVAYYAKSGTYNVSLYVIDSQGARSDTKTVTVNVVSNIDNTQLAPLPTPTPIPTPTATHIPPPPAPLPITLSTLTAAISSPQNGSTFNNSNPIIFTATASGGSGSYKYYWSFGDGVLNNVPLGSYVAYYATLNYKTPQPRFFTHSTNDHRFL